MNKLMNNSETDLTMETFMDHSMVQRFDSVHLQHAKKARVSQLKSVSNEMPCEICEYAKLIMENISIAIIRGQFQMTSKLRYWVTEKQLE